MNKFIQVFCFLMLAFIINSCSTSKQARQYRNTIDGNWQLQTIVSQKITGNLKTMFFNEADFNCFVGSSWSFNKSNSLGTYTLSKNAGECNAVKREIRWSVYEESKAAPKQLQFKRLNEKLKEMDEGGGFRFSIENADKNNMQLKSDIIFEGKPVSFIYNFVRN